MEVSVSSWGYPKLSSIFVDGLAMKYVTDKSWITRLLTIIKPFFS